MIAPQLNCKLQLETPERLSDGAGGYTTVWSVLGTLWAAVEAGMGKDSEASGLSISTVPYKIMVRAAPIGAPSRPIPGCRLRDDHRVFRVLAVTEADHKSRYLMCHAKVEEVST